MTRAFATLTCAASAALLAACAPAPVPYETYMQESARSTCALLFECCEVSRFETVAECEAQIATELEAGLTLVNASVDAGRIRYDGDAARTCFDGTTCTEGPDACTAILVPLVEDGGECANSAECISRNCVIGAAGGTCQGTPGEGEACTTACASGLYCDVLNPPSTCMPQRAPGQTCESALQCASLACTDGICEAPVSPAICRLDG